MCRFSQRRRGSIAPQRISEKLGGLLVALLIFGGGIPAFAQPMPGPSPDSDEGPIVRSVQFEGNSFFSDSALQRRIRTSPNRRFLGIPGFTWWRWIYKLGESEALGQRLSEALQSNGEPPAYLDSVLVANDVERLRVFYRQQGFRDVQVRSEIHRSSPDRARVVFYVEPGAPTHIRTVEYTGVEHLTDAQKQRLARESVLEPEQIDRERPLQFTLSEEQRYVEPQLVEERQRLLTFLRNEGYARVTRDSIRAFVRTPTAEQVDVEFRIRTGERYRFGDLHFSIVGPEEEAPARDDTLDVPVEAASGYAPRVTARIEQERRLSPALLRRAMQFTPGSMYDRSAVLATKRRLEGTGVFTFTNITPLASDTMRENGSRMYLPHRIEARTRPRHNIRAETFLIQRSEVVPGAENELGTGVGVTYQNGNMLGGGETFQVGASGSVAANFDLTFLTSAQAEISTSITTPYLVRPFSRLDQALNLYGARTRLSFSLLTARRDALSLILRGRGTTRLQLEMQHTPTLTSLVDLFDVSLSNPDTLSGFSRDFLDKVIGRGDSLIITDPVQRAQILDDYTQPQVNSAVRYTLRASTTNPLRRARGYHYEASAEVGNTVPYLLDRLAFSPDTLENSLPGLPFLGSGDSGRLIYRPYVRFTTDLRHYQPLSNGTVLALKFLGGLAHPTGRPDLVPFDRRFYSGGASSVRGWSLRELGPGRAALDTTATRGAGATNVLGGDIKLEASAELRTTLLRNVLATDWLGTTFVDAGNVWFGPRNPGDPAGRFQVDSFLSELGVGAGFGLRLSWDYLIVRFDLAYRMYDPLPQNEGFFEDGTATPQLHFGIGHAF